MGFAVSIARAASSLLCLSGAAGAGLNIVLIFQWTRNMRKTWDWEMHAGLYNIIYTPFLDSWVGGFEDGAKIEKDFHHDCSKKYKSWIKILSLPWPINLSSSTKMKNNHSLQWHLSFLHWTSVSGCTGAAGGTKVSTARGRCPESRNGGARPRIRRSAKSSFQQNMSYCHCV